MCSAFYPVDVVYPAENIQEKFMLQKIKETKNEGIGETRDNKKSCMQSVSLHHNMTAAIWISYQENSKIEWKTVSEYKRYND